MQRTYDCQQLAALSALRLCVWRIKQQLSKVKYVLSWNSLLNFSRSLSLITHSRVHLLLHTASLRIITALQCTCRGKPSIHSYSYFNTSAHHLPYPFTHTNTGLVSTRTQVRVQPGVISRAHSPYLSSNNFLSTLGYNSPKLKTKKKNRRWAWISESAVEWAF